MGRIVGLQIKEIVQALENDQEPEKHSGFDGMDVEQLKAYAVEHNIDIGNATSAKGILKKITDAEAAARKDNK